MGAQCSDALLHSGLLEQVLPEPCSLEDDTCYTQTHTHTLLSVTSPATTPNHGTPNTLTTIIINLLSAFTHLIEHFGHTLDCGPNLVINY